MSDGLSMVVNYWGIRGSVPSPLTSEQVIDKDAALIARLIQDGGTTELFGDPVQPEKIRAYLKGLPLSLAGTYGGDTTCVEIQARDSPLIIIDAGTGARLLGNALFGRIFSGNKSVNPLNDNELTKKDIHIFFTHYHWDHLQGFPFFGPGFTSLFDIHFYGKADTRGRLSEVLAGQQQYPNFPVEWRDMPCVVSDKQYHELGRMTPSPIKIGNAVVSYIELDHPDRVFGYAVQVDGVKYAFATDTEHRDSPDPELVKLAKGARVLYYDAQYLPEEYKGEKGMHKFRWGTVLTNGVLEQL